MILKTRKPWAAVAVAMTIGLVGCSDDKKPEEVVQPAPTTQQPATPPEPTPAVNTADVTQAVFSLLTTTRSIATAKAN